jgi:hypothetical protein
LIGLVRNELGPYPREITRRALAGALLADRTEQIAAMQDGSAGRGRPGISRLRGFLEKVLRTKAEDLTRALKISEAKDRTEHLVHQSKLKSRLQAVRSAGRPSRANTGR